MDQSNQALLINRVTGNTTVTVQYPELTDSEALRMAFIPLDSDSH